jgi:hypothetical protein
MPREVMARVNLYQQPLRARSAAGDRAPSLAVTRSD